MIEDKVLALCRLVGHEYIFLDYPMIYMSNIITFMIFKHCSRCHFRYRTAYYDYIVTNNTFGTGGSLSSDIQRDSIEYRYFIPLEVL